jgi:hypothetical protein
VSGLRAGVSHDAREPVQQNERAMGTLSNVVENTSHGL